MAFRDRSEAGRQLAGLLDHHRGTDAVVLGLARGGVPVASELARSLRLPLDVFVVRKLGVPQQPELAMGAVGSGGILVLNEEVLRHGGISRETLERAVARESAELVRRERLFRAGRAPRAVERRTAILVDDGIATGSSMRVAIRGLRDLGAGAVVVAVPVAPPSTCAEIAAEVDEIVCSHQPSPFLSVGTWYEDFAQVSDAEVRDLLARGQGEP